MNTTILLHRLEKTCASQETQHLYKEYVAGRLDTDELLVGAVYNEEKAYTLMGILHTAAKRQGIRFLHYSSMNMPRFALGCFDSDTNEIWLRNSIIERVPYNATLAHELTHAMTYKEYNFNSNLFPQEWLAQTTAFLVLGLFDIDISLYTALYLLNHYVDFASPVWATCKTVATKTSREILNMV